MEYELHDFVGNIGVLLVVGSYFALSGGWVRPDQLRYGAANALGSVLIAFSLMFDFNLSSFMIEVVWFSISVYAMARALRERRARGEPALGGRGAPRSGR